MAFYHERGWPELNPFLLFCRTMICSELNAIRDTKAATATPSKSVVLSRNIRECTASRITQTTRKPVSVLIDG